MTGAPRNQHERVKDVERKQEAWRSDAQVDVDRLLYSPEFRRLAGVTQVVPPQDDYLFHDRLTHSIKVAQVAETLARMLISRAGDSVDFRENADLDLSEWVNPSHCYAAGLAHDIGHPPFGHAGEQVLQGRLGREVAFSVDSRANGQNSSARVRMPFSFGSMKRRRASGGFSALRAKSLGASTYSARGRSFEGNAQSTRIVANLSFRTEDLDCGLNLTLRTLAGVAKYPWLRGGHPEGRDKLANKWSFYPEESALLDRLVRAGYVRVDVDEKGAISKVARWVEAEIMDWADDISYAVHDVEDFFRAGLIPLAEIGNALKGVNEQADMKTDWAAVTASGFDSVDDDSIRESLSYASAKLTRAAGNLPDDSTSTSVLVAAAFEQIGLFALSAFPSAPFTGSRRSHVDLHRFSSAVIGYLSNASELVVSNEGRVQLHVDSTGVLVAEFFKALNKYFVIESVELAAMQYGQERVLVGLFDAMFELSEQWMTKFAQGDVSGRLPARLRSYLKEIASEGDGEPATDRDAIAVAVVDYITSLRDVQAIRLAGQLAGARDVSALSGSWLNS